MIGFDDSISGVAHSVNTEKNLLRELCDFEVTLEGRVARSLGRVMEALKPPVGDHFGISYNVCEGYDTALTTIDMVAVRNAHPQKSIREVKKTRTVTTEKVQVLRVEVLRETSHGYVALNAVFRYPVCYVRVVYQGRNEDPAEICCTGIITPDDKSGAIRIRKVKSIPSYKHVADPLPEWPM